MLRRWLPIFLGAFLWLSACGPVTVFVVWNTGDIDEALQSGFVLIIGTPHAEPLREVVLVEGEIPSGMEIQDDGTVQGIPEQSGFFDFTLGLTETNGRSLERSYSVEVDAQN